MNISSTRHLLELLIKKQTYHEQYFLLDYIQGKSKSTYTIGISVTLRDTNII